MGSAAEELDRGRAALAAGDPRAALVAFTRAVAIAETGDGLAGLAEATHRAAGFAAAAALFGRAYAAYEREGRETDAARVARTLAYHYVLHGDEALVGGWLGQARRMVDLADGAHGLKGCWVELFDALGDPDVGEREGRLRRVAESARSLGDRALKCDALGLVGRLCIDDGRVREGMELLDASLTAVAAGEVAEVVVVEGALCLMLGACESLQDVERAERWVTVGDRLGTERGVSSLGPLCRGYYAGVLIAAGRWDEAETALTDTIEGLRDGYVLARDSALVRLADLRLRQGSLKAAEELLRGLEHPDAAYPLAALHLARGEGALARDRIERGLMRAVGVTEGRLWGLLVDVLLAAGDLDGAAEAADRLAGLATDRASGVLTALAALARGRVCLVGATGDATACLREALVEFARARMPVELALARLDLAVAVARTAPEVAMAEAGLALDVCSRIGAQGPADRAAALLRDLGGTPPPGPRDRDALSRREREVLDLLGHGLTNPEIAARLVISRKTVEHHVSRVLAKLGLRNRAEAAAYAVRHPPS